MDVMLLAVSTCQTFHQLRNENYANYCNWNNPKNLLWVPRCLLR